MDQLSIACDGGNQLLALLAVTTETLLGIATPTTAPPPAEPAPLLGGVEPEEQAPSSSVTTPSTAPSKFFRMEQSWSEGSENAGAHPRRPSEAGAGAVGKFSGDRQGLEDRMVELSNQSQADRGAPEAPNGVT